MSKNFEQISIKPGFMKHNGGIMFKWLEKISLQMSVIYFFIFIFVVILILTFIL